MNSIMSPPVTPLPARTALLAQPSGLHPALWRAHGGSERAGSSAVASGFAALDAELPGGGWPVRVLTELLLAQPGLGEIRLLAPALAALACGGRSVMLFDPPAELSATALAQLGWPPGQCIIVRGRDGACRPSPRRYLQGADVCWALEQALRSGQAGAVLAWLGAAARPEALRRLQLAAQSHEGPAFLLRELAERTWPSPAPLRLALCTAGPDELAVQVIKRRGPAMARPLRLALAPVLSERARARALAWRAGVQAPGDAVQAVPGPAVLHTEPR
jgi:protein ImuA